MVTSSATETTTTTTTMVEYYCETKRGTASNELELLSRVHHMNVLETAACGGVVVDGEGHQPAIDRIDE